MANVHPWFGNVSINDAAGWTYEFFEQVDVTPAQALSNKPTMYIAETGWPSVKSFSYIYCRFDDLNTVRPG
jgi:exo-beta-1,3-glucanase (GH17 family)